MHAIHCVFNAPLSPTSTPLLTLLLLLKTPFLLPSTCLNSTLSSHVSIILPSSTSLLWPLTHSNFSHLGQTEKLGLHCLRDMGQNFNCWLAVWPWASKTGDNNTDILGFWRKWNKGMYAPHRSSNWWPKLCQSRIQTEPGTLGGSKE